MAKNPTIIGNWKMYKTAREAVDYIKSLLPLVEGCKAHLLLAVPYTSIAPASQFAKNTNIAIGAQNMNDAREGAFTGEVASLMLKEAGAVFVILGHSERRLFFHETNESIRKKAIRALQDDLCPVLCIGETLEERERGETEQVLKEQLFSVLEGMDKGNVEKIIIAYEPVWAIGSGKHAAPDIAQKTHAYIRELLAELFGKRVAGKMSILYGGSVNPKNALLFMNESDVDGVLVGGASLDPEIFASIAMQCATTVKPKTTRKAVSKKPSKTSEN